MNNDQTIWWLGGLMLVVILLCWLGERWHQRRLTRQREEREASERRVSEARQRAEDRAAWRVTGSNRSSLASTTRSSPIPPTSYPKATPRFREDAVTERRRSDAHDSTLGDWPATTMLLHTPAMQAGEPSAPVEKRGGDWPSDDSASRFFGLPGLSTPSPAPEPESCRRDDYTSTPSPAPEPPAPAPEFSPPTYSTPSYAPAPDYSSPSPSPSYDSGSSSSSFDSGSSSSGSSFD